MGNTLGTCSDISPNYSDDCSLSALSLHGKSIRNDSDDKIENFKKNFLVVHRRDKHSILELKEVDGLINYQSKEMSTWQSTSNNVTTSSNIERKNSRINYAFSDEDTVTNSIMCTEEDGASSLATPSYTGEGRGVPSVIAPSTNNTDVTKVRCNVDRYAIRKKFRQKSRLLQQQYQSNVMMGGIDENSATSPDPQQQATPSSPPTPSNPSSCMDFDLRRKFQSRSGQNSFDDESIWNSNSNRHPQPKVGSPRGPAVEACSLLFGACLGEQLSVGSRQKFSPPYEYTAETGGHNSTDHAFYSNAIHLRMRAKLGSFYVNSYLPLHPNSPKPNDIKYKYSSSKRRFDDMPPGPPQLINASSSESSTSTSTSERQSKLRTGSITADESTAERQDYVGYFNDVSSSPVCLMVDGSSFFDMAVTGSLGLVDRSTDKHGRNNSSNNTPKKQQNRKSPNHYIVLINRRSGLPLAVCALKSPKGPPIVRIFTTKPRSFGQKPAATTDSIGLDWSSTSLPLYAWAEIITDGLHPNPVSYSIYMSTGIDGRYEKTPSYRASHFTNDGCCTPDILITGRTELESEADGALGSNSATNSKGCALLSLTSEDNDFRYNSSCHRFTYDCNSNNDVVDENETKQHYFSLSVARGVDPALFICFASIVDETMEKSMRHQCESYRRTSTGR